MKKRYTYIFTVVVLLIVIISVLTYNLVKLNATINNEYSIAYKRYYGHLIATNLKPIMEKEALDIKHIQDIRINMIKATEIADIMGVMKESTDLYSISFHINNLLGDVEALYDRNKYFTKVDYENYLIAREYIGKIKNLLENEKYKNLNNKSIRELNTNISNLYSEFLKKVGY